MFPDGTEFVDVPVFATDAMLDIALLGPIDTDLPTVTLGNGEDFPTGTDTFLIGYPGEFDQFPQPSFSRGLISRKREWPAADLTLIQTDHVSAGGQSGGALVSLAGEVIGVSKLSLTQAGFSGALSMADLQDRIERMIDGENTDRLGDRSLELVNSELSMEFSLENEWDHAAFVLIGEPGASVDLNVSSDNDAYYFVENVFGDLVIETVDASYSGEEPSTFTFDDAGLLFADVSQSSPFPGTFTVSCGCDMVQIGDIDDGTQLQLGIQIRGNLDFRGDSDFYLVSLENGQTVEIALDSGNFDGLAAASWIGAGDSKFYSDDDSGGGSLGWNPELVFRAPFTGTFVVWVKDITGIAEGGYFIRVREISSDDPRAVPPPPQTVSSPFGDMFIYELGSVPIEFQYPASWTWLPPDPEDLVDPENLVEAILIDNTTELAILVFSEDLAVLDLEAPTLENYTAYIVANAEPSGISVDVRSTVVTDSGFQFERLDGTVLDDDSRYTRYFGVISNEFGSLGFNITTVAIDAAFDRSRDLFEFILDSVRPTP